MNYHIATGEMQQRKPMEWQKSHHVYDSKSLLQFPTAVMVQIIPLGRNNTEPIALIANSSKIIGLQLPARKL